MRLSRFAALLVAVLVTVSVGALWCTQRRPERLRAERYPAVVLVTVDTLNVYFTHLYDPSRGGTRNLVRLADDGVWFRDAYTTVPMTVPSHTALFSGRLPEEVGVMVNGDLVRPQVTTLAELLQAAGYATAAFPSLGVMKVWTGIGQGFDYYDTWELRDPHHRSYRRAPEVAAAARAWMRGVVPRPFFVWIHLSDPHEPYQALEPERNVDLRLDGELVDRYDLASRMSFTAHLTLDPGAHRLVWLSRREPRKDDRGRTSMMLEELELEGEGITATLPSRSELENGIPLRPRWSLELHNTSDHPVEASLGFRGKLFRPPLSEVHEKYPQEVHLVDREIGGIRGTLAELGLEDRALVVVISDHGEGLYGHGVLGHAASAWEDQLRILWLMAGPGIAEGRVIDDGPVLHTDLFPTLLDLLSLPVPADVEGRSLRACWENGGCPVRRSWRAYGIDMSRMRVTAVARYLWPFKAISLRRRGDLLFDLSRDLHEFNGLTTGEPGMDDAVTRLPQTAHDDRSAVEELVQSRAGERELDAEAVKTLRALGYL